MLALDGSKGRHADTSVIFSIISVLYQFVTEVIVEVGQNRGASAILRSIGNLPGRLQTTYVQQVRVHAAGRTDSRARPPTG